jgi:hypothetical protein
MSTVPPVPPVPTPPVTKICPDCDTEVAATEKECPKCHIVFADVEQETSVVEKALKRLAKKNKAAKKGQPPTPTTQTKKSVFASLNRKKS